VRTLVEIGLLNAFLAGVLALGALAARRWSRRPALAHALWVLVLLKLLTPPLVPVPVLAPEEEPARATARAAAPPRVLARARIVSETKAGTSQPRFTLSKDLARASETGEPPLPPLVELPDPVNESSEENAALVEDEPAEAPPQDPAPADGKVSVPGWIFQAGAVVWLAGSLMWFAITGRRIVRFQRLLRYAVPAPAALQERANELSRRLGLARTPLVYLLPGALPPLLWAVDGRPRLFFPRALLDELSAESRDALLVHELAHLCRRDHWVRAIEWLALGLYWWCPLVWYCCQALHAVEEECCDAWVVSELPEAAPAYAAALLETVDFLAGARMALPPPASGFGRMYSLKRRLTMIL
jgi:beta-lactamase regulating signal transducer with metallopeptidase domain